MHGCTNCVATLLARGDGVDLEPKCLEGLERYEYLQRTVEDFGNDRPGSTVSFSWTQVSGRLDRLRTSITSTKSPATSRTLAIVR